MPTQVFFLARALLHSRSKIAGYNPSAGRLARMAAKILLLAFLCSLIGPMPCLPQVKINNEIQPLTEQQALAALRAKSNHTPEDGFEVVSRIRPTQDSRRTAEAAIDVAKSRKLTPYGNGIFLKWMRSGGFVVLECNQKTGMATAVHLVTQDEKGQPVIESEEVEGDVSKSDALMIMRKSEEFMADLLRSSGPGVEELLRRSAPSILKGPFGANEDNLLAVPDAVRRVSTQQEELLDLVSVEAAVSLKLFRYALAMPVYAADPRSALGLAEEQLALRSKRFLSAMPTTPSHLEDLMDLKLIHAHAELIERLHWLRGLNSYLDKNYPLSLDSETHVVNSSISMTPLFLSVEKQGEDRLYGSMGLTDLICIWSRTDQGDFVLRGLSAGE